MLEIRVTVSCPDILAAAKLLAKGISISEPVLPETPAPAPTAVAAPVAQSPAVTAPVAPAPTAPVVPLAAAPTFTLQQICKAGADLVTQNPGMLPQVNALLAQYGVQAVTDLKPEHFGAVATALRGMGAQI